MSAALKQAILNEARRLGFILAGVTTPDPPLHLAVFEKWLSEGRQGSMDYLAVQPARARRADPSLILPDCKSILVLAVPYSNPSALSDTNPAEKDDIRGRVAAYAWGFDYHIVIPKRLRKLVLFIEKQVGHQVPNHWYTDTGPVLERDLAQRAGLGWIGKNTCLINPKLGSYFLLAELFLGLELEPDAPFATDQCGTCIRCIEACPTKCILPDRTIDARRCISYLTIELKDEIPAGLRSSLGDWVFGCDVCQQVCPWNRFAPPDGNLAFKSRGDIPNPSLLQESEMSPSDFNRKFKDNPVKRAKYHGYLRNAVVAIGNSGKKSVIPRLRKALKSEDAMVRNHAQWALDQLKEKRAA